MRHARTRIIMDGAIAGIIGAVVVALWFLISDTIRGHPLETPSLLAATLLHGVRTPEVHRGLVQLALEYSLIHFSAFIAFGIAGALLLETCETEQSLLFSLVIFFVAFEVFFIAVVLFLGPNAMAQLTWWGIIIGNLLATAAMLSYFFWQHPRLARNLLGAWISVAMEGVKAGLIGATVVAVWFLCYDFASRDPFHTPALLGAMVFQDASVGDGIRATLPLVLGYTILHFFAFVAFGLVLAVMLAASEWEPLMTLGALLLLAVFEVFFVGFVSLLDQSALEVLGWWKIIAGNILALIAMIAYFMRVHRGLHIKLVERWAMLDSEGEEMGDAPTPPPVERRPERLHF
ncbi:MAG: hypothetical protein Q7S58_13440 [Candidatus Binatus sp.]|uniref:hypothetical protein n=1 Tax=Candidatus Binatus sp. TaxID=2811406 RepID=UPI00271B59EF|nr:hypothetical protein [Candidatus Binatus sp.]MDO8433402.1 hypothetical protein [Candidatus Binatus sp.]